ncbi:unnamed protein product [Rhizophagus irregularis]|nr:unnamed protein product [Rhizophagus irregularis]
MKTNFFTECSDWTLLSFLKFRQKEDNWTADKMKEHNTYTRTLGKISGTGTKKQQTVALSALKIFSEIQNTKAIKDFWQGVEELNRRNEINKKKTKYLDNLEKSTYGMLDITRSNVVADAKAETRKRRSMEGTGSKISTRCRKRNKSSESQTIAVGAGQLIIDKSFTEETNTEEIHIEADSEESDSEVVNVDEKEEIGNLTEEEINIRNKLLEILTRCQDNEKKSGKNHMKSISLNSILDLSDMGIRRKIEKLLNEDQLAWVNKVLKKQTSRSRTDEFKKYLNQFNEDACNRAQIPTLVRKSFVSGRFDSYYYEDYDIVHQLLEHCATRLEAHISYESKSFNLERTFAIDTVIYILNRLFKMHQDVLDSGWIELTTPHTKNHKFDGLIKVIRTKLENQVIVVVEFSSGRKASTTKENNDHVKLCRNAMRIFKFNVTNYTKGKSASLLSTIRQQLSQD